MIKQFNVEGKKWKQKNWKSNGKKYLLTPRSCVHDQNNLIKKTRKNKTIQRLISNK
jgi:hypothetical protein